MTAVCSRCSRTNPADARYCYHDGASLAGGAGPMDVARQAFATPFVFPSGQQCRNFDEFAMACEQHWKEAGDLLGKGYLQSFFGSLGRVDLAVAAEEAAKFPDRERGLDQLLARLPSKSLAAPKLQVRPQQLHLGQVKIGQNHRFELELDNAGSRLIFGTVASGCKWLAPGDGESKLVQFTHALTVPVVVRGQHLRAGMKGMEGEIVIETNAGSVKVKITADVPIQPYPDGPLAGSRTPRELAEKAKKAPKDAGPYFASGAVARWYAANGWTYPVDGPSASGLGAVQQFFEALGLTKPPKVTISDAALHLSGAPGAKLQCQVVVKTDEGRPVFANGRGSANWIDAQPALLKGAIATVPVEVTVPDRPGETVKATLHVQSNGNQRFDVPVVVTVDATSRRVAAGPPPIPRGDEATRPTKTEKKGRTRTERPVPASTAPSNPAAKALHLVPVLLLLLPLFGLVASDFVRDIPKRRQVNVNDEPDAKQPLAKAGGFKVDIQDEPDEMPFVPVKFRVDDEPEERVPGVGSGGPAKVEIKDEPVEGGPMGAAIDRRPLVMFQLSGPPSQFGVTATGAAGAARFKRLTYDTMGRTNTTVLRINGASGPLGAVAGRWLRTDVRELIDGIDATPDASSRSLSTWAFGTTPAGKGGLHVHQVLEVVPGQAVVVGGVSRRQLDTVLVRWIIHNQDRRAHNVGLRLQLDTLIGSNDGVPFTVPGFPGLVDTIADFRQAKDVPDFIQALEFGNLRNPGTIAHLTAKIGGAIEPPGRLLITHWPGTSLAWDIPSRNLTGDSAVVLYWMDRQIKSGGKRVIGFAYGLGNVSTNDKLGVTLGGSFEPGQSFTVTAYVENPVPGQTVKLTLPDGLRLLSPGATQSVAAGGGARKTGIVTWKAQVERPGSYRLVVASSTGLSQAKLLSIGRAEGPVGGRFTLDLAGSFEPGREFNVLAKVIEPVAGQTLTLDLPAGLERVGGAPMRRVPEGVKEPLIVWKVKVANAGKHKVRVVSSTGLTQAKTITIEGGGGRSASNFRLLLGGDFAPGKTFDVTAQVTDPAPGQTLTLQLPPGLQRVGGTDLQRVPPGAASSLTWKVQVQKEGKYSLRVASSTGVTQRKSLVIESPNLAGRFAFDLEGEIRPGKEFVVHAKVAEPAAGQTLTLTLPPQLRLAGGEARQSVPAAAPASVTWRVQVVQGGRLPVRVESSTGLTRTKTITLTDSSGGTLFGQ